MGPTGFYTLDEVLNQGNVAAHDIDMGAYRIINCSQLDGVDLSIGTTTSITNTIGTIKIGPNTTDLVQIGCTGANNVTLNSPLTVNYPSLPSLNQIGAMFYATNLTFGQIGATSQNTTIIGSITLPYKGVYHVNATAGLYSTGGDVYLAYYGLQLTNNSTTIYAQTKVGTNSSNAVNSFILIRSSTSVLSGAPIVNYSNISAIVVTTVADSVVALNQMTYAHNTGGSMGSLFPSPGTIFNAVRIA